MILSMKRIAILLTCHNRRAKTINCLKSLYKTLKVSNPGIKSDIYLVDDGSTDGTSQEIIMHFPGINLIKGSGELYWAGGMRLAWETALSKDRQYDSFILLNDDVILMVNFLMDLLNTHEHCLEHFHQSGIYACSTIDSSTSKISYGGTLIKRKGIKVESARITPGDVPVPCSIANANILMVTMEVVESIGILDSKYTQQFADYDYTLAASKKGIPVLVCPGFGGSCVNDHGRNWLPSNSTLKDRIDYLYSPLGLAYKEQLYYLKKNFKYQFSYYFIMLWLKTIAPFIWDKFKKDQDQAIV
jgi:GT2 family glycosyltransferase